MRYTPIDPQLFIENRKKFVNLLHKDSFAFFCSSDHYPSSADGLLPFYQDSDFFYLTGWQKPNSFLLLFPEALDIEEQEILFVPQIDEKTARWEGAGLTLEAIQKLTGITRIAFNDELSFYLKKFFATTTSVYLNSNEHLRATSKVITATDRWNLELKQNFPLHQVQRSAPLLRKLRMQKDPLEIALIQKAIQITELGFRKVMQLLKKPIYEYEIEAEFIYLFTKHQADGFAYHPIIGAGQNSCVLHYNDNKNFCQAQEIVLLDVGAAYAHYNADITRVFPVGGRFSKRQQQVYRAVLRVKNFAESLLKPGILLKTYQQQVILQMQEELLQLELLTTAQIKENPKAYQRYFMHGTSHFLGLDVHDVGDIQIPLMEDAVVTVEPGIYIPEENLGIRLEDNIWVRSEKNVNLSQNIPILIEELEELMH